MSGLSTSGTTVLGTDEVSGRNRVPSPPTRITACIAVPHGASGCQRSAADALVREPRGAHGAGVQRVAPVEDDRPGHALGDGAPVEADELVPLGDEHDRV